MSNSRLRPHRLPRHECTLVPPQRMSTQVLTEIKVARLFLALLFCVTSIAAQTGEASPGDNLVLDGVPNIPASLAEAVGRYTDFRTARLLDWHPSRREMLVRTR